MPRVAILSFAQTALFELGCAVELFGLPRPEFADWYHAEVVSFDPGPLQATSGLTLLPRHIQSLDGWDMLVVPGWSTHTAEVPALLRQEILALHARGGRVLSFCSGAFLLAACGLLDDREATTHWRYAEQFQARFPRVRYVNDVLYVYDGRIGCSAGSAAGIDLGIEVIRGDYGYTVANQVARRLVMAAHRSGGQAQFVETPVLRKPEPLAACLDWAVQNLHKPLNIDTLAARANMSRRSFDRHFRNSLRLTPGQWLTRQRLQLARQLLESSPLPVELIASRTGFATAMSLRHHFREQMGLSPSQYRAQFSSSGPRSLKP